MINKYGIFKLYIPAPESEKGKVARDINALFIQDNAGNDWYELLKTLDKKALKIVFTDDGVIQFANYDASALWPVDSYIAVVDKNSIPPGFDVPTNDLSWQYIDGEIVPRVYTKEEQITQAVRNKNAILDSARKIISPLQDAFDLDIATDDEVKKLAAWKKYRVLLNRIDVNTAPDIDWPNAPE
ncbi:tail fiber assembly protein [Rouxiella sp. Mn2063]|uniref:tail fiber assembly protein n=1 Tax=Rouxiella sp. Mn2063 TaxID=3395262 RepID=UPI003BCCDD73